MAYSANSLSTSFRGCPLIDADYSSTYLRSFNSTFIVPTIVPALQSSMHLSTSQRYQNLGYSPCRLTILSAGEAVSCRRRSLLRPQYLFNTGGFGGAMQASFFTGQNYARTERVVMVASGARSAGAVHGSRARRLNPRRKMKCIPVEEDEKNVRFLRKPCGRHEGHPNNTNRFISVDALETKYFSTLCRSSILATVTSSD